MRGELTGPDYVQRAVDLAPIVMMVVDGTGQIVWVGGNLEALAGYEPAEVVGTSVLDFIDTSWNPIALEAIGAALTRQGLQRAMLYRLFRKDGSTLIAEVQANSQWHDPEFNAMTVYLRRWDEQMLLNEVVEHVASRAPIRETLELLSRIMGAETLDGRGVVLYDLREGAFCGAATGFDLPQVLRSDETGPGAPWHATSRSGEPQWARVEELEEPVRSAAMAEGYRWCWTWPVVASGEPAGCLVLWREADEEPDHTCTMLLDNLVGITGLVIEREQQERELLHAANHDPLTGLVNRAHFFGALQDALDGGQGPQVGVLYVDLDRFKPVNDTLGHGVGDQVLRAVGRRLSAAVREGDLVARLGGDEFAVLCDGVDGDAVLAGIAERISRSIAQPMAFGDEQVSIGASVGIAHAPPGSCSIDVLLDAADAALYDVKANGRGGWQVKLPG